MIGFDPGPSGVRSYCSVNCATTTALYVRVDGSSKALGCCFHCVHLNISSHSTRGPLRLFHSLFRSDPCQTRVTQTLSLSLSFSVFPIKVFVLGICQWKLMTSFFNLTSSAATNSPSPFFATKFALSLSLDVFWRHYTSQTVAKVPHTQA